MNDKEEAKALADAERHARAFCTKHNVPLAEWQKAEQCHEALIQEKLTYFWKLWTEDHNGNKAGKQEVKAISS